MLDLTTLNANLYDIKLLDGTVLHLKRPNQSMVQYLVDIKDLHEDQKEEKALLKAFAGFFCRVLNRNTEGLVYSAKDVEEDYDYETILYVINDYFDYWTKEVGENVDFPQGQPQS